MYRIKTFLNAISIIIVSILLLSACGDTKSPPQTIGIYQVSFITIPNPPTVGLNTFRVRVWNDAGDPVSEAEVHLHYSMPAMAGMPAMGDEARLEETGKGIYQAQVDLSSGGEFPWDVRLEVLKYQQVLFISQWQVIPGNEGVAFVSGETGQERGMGGNSYYTCTMHPSVKQKDPGKCPICAMDLVPVSRAGENPAVSGTETPVAIVNIPLYQQQLIGVQLDTVKLRGAHKTIRTIGHVAYDETRLATVNLKFSGWIEKLYVEYAGEFVEKGQPLFEIYSPEVVSTQEEYLQLLKESARISRSRRSVGTDGSDGAGDSQSLLQSARQRLRLWGISPDQIQEIETTGVPKLTITFYSPIRGYVVNKNALEGSHVVQGKDLFTIADLSRVWVHAQVYEYELPFVRPGQSAQIRLSYAPEVNYTGVVNYIYPTLNPQTRTATIRLEFPNPRLKLKPDMYADVEIAIDLGEQLIVPATAVLNTGRRQLVFVNRGRGRFEPRAINAGAKVGEFYVVHKGLEAGEVVVKSGNFLIDAEAHVQGVLQMLEN